MFKSSLTMELEVPEIKVSPAEGEEDQQEMQDLGQDNPANNVREQEEEEDDSLKNRFSIKAVENNNNNNDDEDESGKANKRTSVVTLSPATLEVEEHRQQAKMSLTSTNLSPHQHSTSSRRASSKRASFALTTRPLKHYLTREVLPHVDHYRNRLSFSKGAFFDVFLCHAMHF